MGVCITLNKGEVSEDGVGIRKFGSLTYKLQQIVTKHFLYVSHYTSNLRI